MAIRFRSNSELYSEFSNFAPYPIVLDGQDWPTVEHYYQAQKFTSVEYRSRIRLAPHPAAAKNLSKSKSQPRRPDWTEIKVDIMGPRATRQVRGACGPAGPADLDRR